MSRKPLSSRNSDLLPRHGAVGGKGKKKERGILCLDRVTLVTDLNNILQEVTAYGALVLTEGDLKTPTPEIIQLVYLKLLHFCFDVTLDALKQPSFQENAMDFPELMEDVTYRIQFFRVMKKFMRTCLITNFKMEDIFNPESYRTCRCLSAVDNFIRFHVNVYQHDDEIESSGQAVEKLHEEAEELRKTNSNLMEEMSELEQQREQEHDLIEELKEKMVSRCQTLQEKKYREEYLLGQYNSVCDAAKSSEQKLADLNIEFEKRSRRVEDLMKKVVTSPDKLRDKLARLQHKYSEAVASSKDLEAVVRMWESLTSHAHQTPRGVMESLEENFHNVIIKEEKCKSLEVRYETMEVETQKLSRQLRETNQKHQKLLQFLKQQVEETDRLACQNATVSNTRTTDDLLGEVTLFKQEVKKRQQENECFVEMTRIEQRSIVEHQEATCAALAEIDELTGELLQVQRERATEYRELTSHLDMMDML